MLTRRMHRNTVARTLVLCFAIILSAAGCSSPESIPLDQPVVIGAPRLAAITVINNRSESIQVLPADAEEDGAVLIEPDGSWTVQATVDRVTTPREWRRHPEFGLFYIEDADQGSILTTLGATEYFIGEGIDTYVLRIDVGDDSEPWRVEIKVDAAEMSVEEPFQGDLVIATDEMVSIRIP